MTPEEWKISEDPDKMLAYLRNQDLLDDEMIRLIAIGCCRASREAIPDWGRTAVEVAKRYVDGDVEPESLRLAFMQMITTRALNRVSTIPSRTSSREIFADMLVANATSPYCLDHQFTADERFDIARDIFFNSALSLNSSTEIAEDSFEYSQKVHADLLREIFGQEPAKLNEFDRNWQTSTVNDMIRTIKENEGALKEITPVLADALQDGGCNNEQILEYCRQEQARPVRAGRVIDRILGRPLGETFSKMPRSR